MIASMVSFNLSRRPCPIVGKREQKIARIASKGGYDCKRQQLEIEPTADSLALVGTACRAAHGLWRPGFRYAKAGVLLLDLYRAADLPMVDMFASRDPERSRSLMTALDTLNGRFGGDTVRPGGIGQKRGWSMRRRNLSPCYTTRVDDLMRVLA